MIVLDRRILLFKVEGLLQGCPPGLPALQIKLTTLEVKRRLTVLILLELNFVLFLILYFVRWAELVINRKNRRCLQYPVTKAGSHQTPPYWT